MNIKPNHSYKDLNKALTIKKARLKQRIKDMLITKCCVFLTLTFSDEILNNTTAKTRERYIKDYLNAQSCYKYIANCDYGKDNKREHYHALIIRHNIPLMFFDSVSDYNESNMIDFKAYKYGKITASFKDIRQINIMVEHFIKDTTKNSKIIYSKMKYNKADFSSFYNYQFYYLNTHGFTIHKERSIKDKKAIESKMIEQHRLLKDSNNKFTNLNDIELLNINIESLNDLEQLMYNAEISKRAKLNNESFIQLLELNETFKEL